jgi:hypothetical protein
MKNQKGRIMDLLSDRRPHTNRELNQICFAYSQRIGELNKTLLAKGLVITSRNAPHDSSLWFYQLEEIDEFRTDAQGNGLLKGVA